MNDFLFWYAYGVGFVSGAMAVGAVLGIRAVGRSQRRMFGLLSRLPTPPRWPNGTACRSHQDQGPEAVSWDWEAMRERGRRRGII